MPGLSADGSCEWNSLPAPCASDSGVIRLQIPEHLFLSQGSRGKQ